MQSRERELERFWDFWQVNLSYWYISYLLELTDFVTFHYLSFLCNRLARRLDKFQPPKQARFRSGYGTTGHITDYTEDRKV